MPAGLLGRISGGLTTRGRCLLAAGLAAALCAVLLNERDLLRVGVFAVVLPLLATLVAGSTKISVRAARELRSTRIPLGCAAEACLVVRSAGRLGAGRLGGRLLLEDEVPQELGAAPQFVVVGLPRRRAVRLSYPLHPAQRGVHSVGPLVARITDPFGLAEFRRILAGQCRLVVTPVVVPLTGLPAGGGFGTEEAATGRGGTGRGEGGSVVRGYRQGDDLRQVHWRSTARRDTLMVRVEERPSRGTAAVLLDHRATAHRGSGPASSLEYAVSLAASLYAHLQRHGQRVRLVTQDSVNLADRTLDDTLDALAALRAVPERDLTSGPALAGGQDVVAVLGALGPADVEVLRHRPPGTCGYAVLLDVAAWDPDSDMAADGAPDPAQAARMLVAGGWSVAVAGPEQPLSSIWDRLCLSSGSKPAASR
ncbi:MAG TPA: DUF58 domain-containing protein [Pseudonocardiaceae bacterium]